MLFPRRDESQFDYDMRRQDEGLRTFIRVGFIFAFILVGVGSCLGVASWNGEFVDGAMLSGKPLEDLQSQERVAKLVIAAGLLCALVAEATRRVLRRIDS